jgi:hypothetical protein
MTAATDSRPSLGATASPPATRHVQRPWRDPRLVVGVLLVALSVVLGARLLAGADDSVAVWAARTGLRAGQPVGAADLVRRQVGFTDRSDADRYLSADRPVPAGTTLARDVGPGELLPRAALAGASAPAATEVPVAVDADAVPATVRAGSVVDVWVAPRADGSATAPGGGTAQRVFDDVVVVSAPRSAPALGPSATRQVIVGVDGDQEAHLPEALARLAGGSVLLTRQH